MADGIGVARRAVATIERAWLRRGPLACILWPLALMHGLALKLRRPPPAQWLDVPVVVIGNLIAGGAGKTPTVLAVAELLREAGWHPGIVSRGYGRSKTAIVDVTADTAATASGDEPLLLHRRLRLPVVVGRDRVAAARALRRAHREVDVILADDGLQHARLGRHAEVIVFDERGVGNGWLLPAGPLREPMTPRAGPHLVLYNAPAPTTPWPGFTAARGLLGVVELAAWQAGEPASVASLRALAGRPVVAAAGTARPDRFFDMLRAAGLDIGPLPLADHASFDALPWPADTPEVVVTEKDAVKLFGRSTGATRVWVAPLDFRPDPAFGRALLALLPPRPKPED